MIQQYTTFTAQNTIESFRDNELIKKIRELRNMSEKDYRPEVIDWLIRLHSDGRNNNELMVEYNWLWKKMMKTVYGTKFKEG